MVKKNYKLIIGFILGVIVSTTGVYAASTIIKSKDVSYDKSTSGGKYDTVQDAIDELYEKSGLLSEVWKDKTLNGADPVLDVEGSTKKLIPITLDNDGTVHYANLKTKWYDYADKKWANAVILVDNPKNGGEENYNYKVGDIILEEDIESYFVWIPRFSYKIWNMANTEEYNSALKASEVLTDSSLETSTINAFNKSKIINIKFGDAITNPRMNESKATLNEYYTHPAFTLGDKDLNGIWVGKFETGYNQDGDNGEPITIDNNWNVNGAKQNKEASIRIIVKPNVYSWQNNSVKNFFFSAYNYARGLESHMMKNTEWGALAYLSHSVYGIGTEVNANNSGRKTGYSAVIDIYKGSWPIDTGDTKDKTQPYNTLTGYLASTTGNITGVYDMSGGTHEYMASYVSGNVGTSGFLDDKELTTIYKNYFDVYSANSNVSSYNKRILGDATGEMGPFYHYYDSTDGGGNHNSWYSDYANFVYPNNPWFARGGYTMYGPIGGQFSSNSFNGKEDERVGMRLVLCY